MIIFQTEISQINLTHLQPSLTEENNKFVNDSLRNYSLPFNLDLDSEIARKLGLPHIENIYAYKSIIKGILILDNDFFNAYIKLGTIIDRKAKATLFYGEDVLEVYDTNLRDLPWPTIITPTGLSDYAESLLDKTYPETSHNFPMLYRPEIKEREDYSDFKLFVNNWQSQNFLPNNTIVGEETTFRNEYVMAPFPYLLEIVRFLYKQEGLEAKGQFFESEFFKKILYVPDNFFEKFLGNQYDAFQFSTPTSTELIDNQEFAVYEYVNTPNLVGTYEIGFEINLNASLAAIFSLEITRREAGTTNETTVYLAESSGSNVNISDTVEINVTDDGLFDQIKITLKILNPNVSIAPFNSFEYNFQEGRENVFPDTYTLSDFVPDKKAGDFINEIKNIWNLDLIFNDNEVFVNFTEKTFLLANADDKEHLKELAPEKKLNTDRYYVLSYANDERVKVDHTGQVFSAVREFQEELPIKMNFDPLKIRENFGHLTGVYKPDTDGMQFGLYDGIQFRNYFVDNINEEDLSLQQNYNKFWKQWLKFRTNSFSYKESFKAHITEIFDLQKFMYKYNQLHIIKKLTKKRESAKYWKVTSESETL